MFTEQRHYKEPSSFFPVQNFPLAIILKPLKCMYNDLNYELTLKMLYFSLVISNFDYASLILRTNNISQKQNLTLIQNSFLRYFSYEYDVEEILHFVYYDNTCNYFKIMALKILNIIDF